MTNKAKNVSMLAFLFSFVYLFGMGFSTTDVARAQAQESSPLDLTIKSCAQFSVAESHLDAAYHVVTKDYKTIPGRKEPVGELEGIETPEKMKEFMDWYENGGSSEMFLAGEMCRAETLMKSGETAAWKAERCVNSSV